MCTLGFVDPVARVAFSAGHCNASGPVTDRNGRFIGVVTTALAETGQRRILAPLPFPIASLIGKLGELTAFLMKPPRWWLAWKSLSRMRKPGTG